MGVPSVPFEPVGGGDHAQGSSGSRSSESQPGEPRGEPRVEGEPAPRSGRWTWLRRASRWAGSTVAGLLSHFSSPLFNSALLVFCVYAWSQRDAVRIIPIDGPNGAQQAMQLTQAFEAIDAGALAGVDEDLEGLRATTSQPPSVTIPGVNLPLAQLADLPWQTRVQVVLVEEGDGPNKKHRARLQVNGPGISKRLETEALPSLDQALTAAAEQLYAALRPVNAAFYYFSRYPDRALELVQSALADGRRDASAYRIWGLILRDEGDFEGALDKLGQAADLSGDPRRRAHVHVDMGYVAATLRRWNDAVAYFDRAAAEDPQWHVPPVRKADVLRESGDLDGALAGYERGRELSPNFVDAWAGIARVYAARGDVDLAVMAYDAARRASLNKLQHAGLNREIGEVLAGIGCPAEAAERYAAAMPFDPSYTLELRQPPRGQSCPSGGPPSSPQPPRCTPFAHSPTVG